MQTSRDHVHAYQFMTRRMTMALLSGEPDSGDIPARRARLGLVFGVLAAVLLLIGFLVYGLISPGGNTTWQRPGTIVVERESGTRYLYRDGLLKPALNFSSALLAAGRASHVELVSRSSLANVRRGTPFGIPGAPDALPGRTDLFAGNALACVPGIASRPITVTTLVVDPRSEVVALPAGTRLRVAGPDGMEYVIQDSMKYPLVEPTALIALGLDTAPSAVVPGSWLSELATGPAIAAASVPDAGRPGGQVGDRSYAVGQLFQVKAVEGDRYFVLLSDGLAPMSRTEFALMAAHGEQAVTLDPAVATAAKRSAETSLLARLPDLAGGPLAAPAKALCVRHDRGATATAGQLMRMDSGEAAAAVARGAAVSATPGGGVFAVQVAQAGPEQATKVVARYLVTEQGLKYSIPDNESLELLGLSGAPMVTVDGEVLDAVPSGPALTIAALSAAEEGQRP
ncbi:type VII secretion protein EccB [Amycolatopsis japonica]